jgi:predicted metalloendopeptidase
VKSHWLALKLAALLSAAPMAFADSPPLSGIQTADMDLKVRPQDDLFQYANGTWLRDVPIPPDRSSYGVDSLMSERSLTQQRELIEAAQISTDPEARKVSDLYSSYLNEARIERTGIKPLQAELQRVAMIKRASEADWVYRTATTI